MFLVDDSVQLQESPDESFEEPAVQESLRKAIHDKWTKIQGQELQLLNDYIELESCLAEELDSRVLVSKDSSITSQVEHEGEVEIPNFIETLFSRKSPTAVSTSFQKVKAQVAKEVTEGKQVMTEGKQVKNAKECNCKTEIQSLKKEISRLKQELQQKINQEQEFKEKIEKNALKEIQKKEKEWENLRKCSILPSRKERIEVENLKKLHLKEKEELKQKEIRLLLAQDRFKRRIDELSNRNSELLEEVKVLERDRANYLPGKSKNIGIQTEKENVNTACKEATIALSSLASVLELQEPLDIFVYPNKKVEYVYDQVKLVWYPNGTLKENYFSGKQVIYFVNGDKKTILQDGVTVYWYASPDILHTTLPNGLEIFEFSNGQIEKRYKDGTLEIHFPDSTIKYVYADGQVSLFYKQERKKYSFRMEQSGPDLLVYF